MGKNNGLYLVAMTNGDVYHVNRYDGARIVDGDYDKVTVTDQKLNVEVTLYRAHISSIVAKGSGDGR